MLDVYFIRHAESMTNVRPEFIGGQQNHVPLSPRGELQAQALGKRLAAEGIRFDEVYASTAVRAQRTAELASTETGFPLERIILASELLELSQGAWERRPRAEVYTPETLAQIRANNWEFRPPGGESQRDVEERMLAWVSRELLPKYQDGQDRTIAVYSHGLSIKCMLRGIMKFEPPMTYKTRLDNTGIVELKYDQHGWHPRRINDTAHLAGVGKLPPTNSS